MSERFHGDNHSPFGRMRAPKNVTFRGVRRRSYENYSSSFDASDEDCSSEPNGDPGGHLGGGSRGGAAKPRHKAPPLGATGDLLASGRRLSGGARAQPLQMAGSGLALRRGAPPLDPLTSIVMEIRLSYREMWPNGLMDQDAIWYGGRTRPRPHCVR